MHFWQNFPKNKMEERESADSMVRVLANFNTPRTSYPPPYTPGRLPLLCSGGGRGRARPERVEQNGRAAATQTAATENAVAVHRGHRIDLCTDWQVRHWFGCGIAGKDLQPPALMVTVSSPFPPLVRGPRHTSSHIPCLLGAERWCQHINQRMVFDDFIAFYLENFNKI